MARASNMGQTQAPARESGLREARLIRANLSKAGLLETNLTAADLSDANLRGVSLIDTNPCAALFGPERPLESPIASQKTAKRCRPILERGSWRGWRDACTSNFTPRPDGLQPKANRVTRVASYRTRVLLKTCSPPPPPVSVVQGGPCTGTKMRSVLLSAAKACEIPPGGNRC